MSLAEFINFVEIGSIRESLTKIVLVKELNISFVIRTLLFLLL